jgi:hypothetical protein
MRWRRTPNGRRPAGLVSARGQYSAFASSCARVAVGQPRQAGAGPPSQAEAEPDVADRQADEEVVAQPGADQPGAGTEFIPDGDPDGDSEPDGYSHAHVAACSAAVGFRHLHPAEAVVGRFPGRVHDRQ